MSHAAEKHQRFVVRAALLGVGAVCVASGVAVLMMVPPTPTSFYPKCVSYQLTGTHCPGCGTTRALHALLNGNVGQALAYNVLAVLALPYLVLSISRSIWYWLWQRPAQPINFHPKLTWAIAITFMLFWVLRNVPTYPFTLLAPHDLTQ